MGGGFSHFLVYASSALAEQSTPAFLQIDDRRAIAARPDSFDLVVCRAKGFEIEDQVDSG